MLSDTLTRCWSVLFATDTNFLREPANARARTIPQTCDHSEPRLWCIAAVACMCYSPSCYQLLMSEPPPTLSELSLIPRPEALLPCLEQGGLLVCIQVPHLSTQKNHRDRGSNWPPLPHGLWRFKSHTKVMEFFFSTSQATTWLKKDFMKGSFIWCLSNFSEQLFTRTTFDKWFSFFRHLWHFTSVLNAVMVFLQLQLDSCSCAALSKQWLFGSLNK